MGLLLYKVTGNMLARKSKEIFILCLIFLFLPVIRMPVTAKHRTGVSSEHSFIAVRSSNVPQLHVAIFKGCGKCEIILHAELDVPYTL